MRQLFFIFLLFVISCSDSTSSSNSNSDGVKFYSVSAENPESITLINFADKEIDLHKYRIIDGSELGFIIRDVVLNSGETITFYNDSNGFAFNINNSGETLFLLDSLANKLDTWIN
ncbi:MAG: hypothetical protein JXR48_09865 [Candidatus Delongbacteria bacterium]|nr:hypothetical protein [Candidatus Delongbacteria bacterium]MBN2835260.1 hypothetical protein [Candidatus Delongbacteria bacterium]